MSPARRATWRRSCSSRAPAATRASDIYSFGVLLYYLVSARFPVDGKTLGEMRRAHQAGQDRARSARPVPACRLSLSTLVTKAIDRDPAKRPESAAEMQSSACRAGNRAGGAATPRARHSWWVAVPTLAVLALAALLWSTRSSTPTAALPPPNTLAVMPIRNLTGDPSKQYLADGLTEVSSRTWRGCPACTWHRRRRSATLRVRTATSKAIAEKLGVRLLLAGSVLQADERIRISVRLDDPHTGRTIWGTELERQPSNILGARSEIASLVAARLAIEVPSSKTKEARQLKAEAQDAFLRGVVECRVRCRATSVRSRSAF